MRIVVYGALLGIVGIPSYLWVAKAKEKARIASCQADLKQLGLGILMYCQDYDKHFPVAESFPRLADAIFPYTKNN